MNYGHAAFGLPDLYDVDYSSSGLGNWSLMAGGSWNGNLGNSPAMPDAFCRIQMGFASPTILNSNITGQSIPDVEDNPSIFRLWKDGTIGSEYFLVENRQLTSFDQSLPNSGLLIYHVDESVTSDNMNEWYPGHTSSGHYLVALEQADGLYNLEKGNNRGDEGDCYPGSANNQNFSNSTTPDSKNYNLSATGVGVKNISSSSSTMSADLQVIATETTLQIVSPNGGESWPEGYTKQIIIDALNSGSFELEYTTDSGTSWNIIGDVNPSTKRDNNTVFHSSSLNFANRDIPVYNGSVIDWVVPNSPSNQCRVRATSLSDPGLTDQSDGTFNIITVPQGQFSVEFNYDANAVTGGASNYGSIFIPTLNEFWTSRWNSDLLHRWNKNGTLIEQFTIPGVQGVEGFADDGNYIYATMNGSNVIKIIEPVNKTVVGDITAPFNAIYITYDPTADNNSGGFWIGSWTTDVNLIDRAGNILRTLPYSNLNSPDNGGIAYDNYSPGGPYLWLTSQGNGQMIRQISIATGLPTGIEHDILSDVASGTGAWTGSLFISSGLVDGKATIGGMTQGPDHLFGYQLCDISPNVKVLYPNGGEHFKIDKDINIRWTSGLIDNVKIELTTDGSTWSIITSSTPAAAGNFPWTVPNNISDQCKIRISNEADASLFDLSDNVFSIIGYGPIAEVEPNDTRAQATQVAFEDTVDASINPVNDIDYYKIQGNAGDTLMVYAEDQNPSQLDGRIAILDQDGIWLADNDDFLSTLNSRIVYVLPTGGIYYVRYAYYGNNNGVSKPAATEKNKIGPNTKNQIDKNPQLGSNDQGDYRIIFDYFKKSAPMLRSTYAEDVNYNSTRFGGSIYPNGLNTIITIDYGLTTSYVNSFIVTTTDNTIYDWYFNSDQITGLQANTEYHYKVTLQNLLGTVVSEDYNFFTPLAPDGWVHQNSGTANWLPAVDFIDANNGFVVGSGYGNTILKTSNGGNTWTNVCPSNQNPVFFGNSVDMVNTNKVVAIGSFGLILISEDGGNSWVQKQVGNCWHKGVSFADINNGVVVNDCGEVYKTTDGGNNWVQLTSPITSGYYLAVAMLNSNTIVALNSDSWVIRSTDGGSIWTSQQLLTFSNWTGGMSFADINNGIIGLGNTSYLYKTTDGGTTWSQLDPGFGGNFPAVSIIDASNAIVAGNILLRTRNGGATWAQENTGTYNWLYGIKALPSGEAWAVGDWGTILHAEPPCEPMWTPVQNQQYNMNIIAELYFDDQLSLNENDIVGAFVGNECRGVASPNPSLNGKIFLTVTSDEQSGEAITFKAWKSSNCEESLILETMTFENQGEVGTLDNPFEFHAWSS